jgi:site-specific DNA-cytosine methylase
MTYYRLALQDLQTARWSWKTAPVTSLKTVFELLRCYRALIPQDRIRVFTASSREELHELLSRENNGLASGSVSATQFLQERNLLVPERAQSASDQSVSAQAAQQGASVATWAKDLWEQRATLRTAQAAQQAATNATSSALHESIATTGIGMSLLDKKRLEFELGPGGDHDVPYSFALPAYMPQVLAWMRLLAKVQRGELVP